MQRLEHQRLVIAGQHRLHLHEISVQSTVLLQIFRLGDKQRQQRPHTFAAALHDVLQHLVEQTVSR